MVRADKERRVLFMSTSLGWCRDTCCLVARPAGDAIVSLDHACFARMIKDLSDGRDTLAV